MRGEQACLRNHSLVLMFSNRVHLVSLPTPILTWLVLIIIQEPGNLRPIYIPSLWRCQPCTHMPAIQQLRAPLCVWWMELNKTGGLPYNKPYKAPALEELLWLSVQTSKHPSTHMFLTSYRENHAIKRSSWEKYNFRCLTPSQSPVCVWQNEAWDVRNIRKIRVTVRNLSHHWHSEISEGLPAGLIIGLNYIYLWTSKKEQSCTKHF